MKTLDRNEKCGNFKAVLFDFINQTHVHNFTVSAQGIFNLPSTFGIYRKFYRNFASTFADNETFCTVLLTSITHEY